MGTLVDKLLGSDINYITYAVPFFFLLIGVELVAGLIQNKKLYRFNDSINDLSCGIIDQTVGIFLKGLLFAGYLFLFEHFRMFDIAAAPPAAKWVAAIALMLGVDFCFYWFHRIAHEYAAPWATHVVHHQSEEYNLAVALRQSALEGCFAWVFYLPLAVIGFPPAWYVAMSALEPALSVLDSYRGHRPSGPARVRAQHAVAPSRAPCPQSQVSRQELRGHVHHLGPHVRHVPAGGRGAGLRTDQAAA